MLHIILVEPEIPQNTGNIARTCAATGTALHLIEPLGFSLADKYLKRSGLDYWELACMTVHPSLDALLGEYSHLPMFLATTKAPRVYTDADYPGDSLLIFGKETKGLPEPLLQSNYEKCIRIPMDSRARSLNLSNSVAIVLYEALRQNNFAGLTPVSDYLDKTINKS